MRHVVPFLAGVLFAVGLAISGMTQPAKVIGFLDVLGNWDPSLAFVMAGGMAVYAIAWRLSPRRPTAPSARVDRQLLAGSAVFGAGWGLGGYCPGPAVASAAVGGARVAVFLIAMLAGMLVHRFVTRVGREDG